MPAIPYKLFSRLTSSLVEYRTNPSPDTARALDHDEQECDWPFTASAEQLNEWDSICTRTRAEFDEHIRHYHELFHAPTSQKG